LLQQGQHPLAQLGDDGVRPFTAEQVAAKLLLELADRARQRGLRDIALFGGAREIEHARDRQEVSDLMHFHSGILSTR